MLRFFKHEILVEAVNGQDLPPTCIDYLVEKARVSRRRKTKFGDSETKGHTSRWKNHAGTYRDPDTMRSLKYWHSKPNNQKKNSMTYPEIVGVYKANCSW